MKSIATIDWAKIGKITYVMGGLSRRTGTTMGEGGSSFYYFGVCVLIK